MSYTLTYLIRKGLNGNLTSDERKHYIEHFMSQEEKQIGKPIYEMSREEELEYDRLCFNNQVGTLTSYDCPVCKNKGEIMVVRDGVEYYADCSCMQIRRCINNMQRSGLGELLNQKKFSNYKVTEDWQADVVKTAKRFIDSDSNGFVICGQSGCVDCDTEFFNGREWKKISDYNGDKVLQYNPDNKEATLTTPIRYIKTESDELFSVRTFRGSIDMCLSAEHNFAYITTKGHMQKKRFSEVMEAHSTKKQGFYGRVETAFKYNGKGIDLTENEIRLMCAVIADGSFRDKLRQCTIRVKKERKKQRMRELLKGQFYKEYECVGGYSQFRFYAPRREKEFSDYWYDCSFEQLQIIKDEIFNWDGRIDTKGRKVYFTTSKASADFIQFALSATGSRSTIIVDKRVGGIHKHECYRVNAVMGKSTVSLVNDDQEKKAKIQKYIPTDGYKYCFEVETGYLVLRRNDRIFITGNSGKTHICTAISGALLKKGIPLKYMLWVDESKKIKQAIKDESRYAELLDEIKNSPALYIDDFFKNKPSDADKSLAIEIFNYRYNLSQTSKQRYITLLSTELSVAQINEIDSALCGRLCEMAGKEYILSVYGEEKNYRLKTVLG